MWLRDEKDLWGFYQNGEYEPEETKLVQSILKPEWNCIDVGANIGYFTLLMSKCYKVAAYEPEPSNFDLLVKNVQVNRLYNVYIHRMAVANKNGTKKLYLCDKSHGMHRLYKSKHCTFGHTDVDVVKLDDHIGSPIDFIKIDIEGSELAVLEGAKRLLKKDHPIILMEFHPPSIIEYGVEPVYVYDFIKLLGYKITLVPDIEIGNYEQLFEQTNNISGGQNILCV